MGYGGLVALGQGAASGAATGSMFGPWGTAIGGLAGGAIGGLSHLFSDDDEEKKRKEAEAQARAQMAQSIQEQYANDISARTHGPRIPMYELQAMKGNQAIGEANQPAPFDPSSLLPIIQNGARAAGGIYKSLNTPDVMDKYSDADGFKYDKGAIDAAQEEDERQRRLQSAGRANPWAPYA